MIVVHANDLTTRVLSRLYESREDCLLRITEKSTNSQIRQAIKNANQVMMLGHGNPFGLFSTPDKNGVYSRHLINSDHVQFLRGKPCIGIWCYSNEFAKRYGLHGLFSGMIISELHEAEENSILATKEEIDLEMEKFVTRLRSCIEKYDLKEVPQIMATSDYFKSELNKFNYRHLFYYE